MGKLYIVPTPIGNFEDITLRALRVLQESDLILCEDTRQTIKLLNKYQINRPLKAFHQHNEHYLSKEIAEYLKEDVTYSLVSDAGTPGISDPAYLLINSCLQNNVKIECLPGASALIPAIIESGFPSDSFIFDGFLPHKKGKLTKIKSIADEQRTIVVYESPHRLIKSLEMMKDIFEPDRKISVSRELTKIYAETIRGTVNEVLNYFKSKPVLGEFVIVIDGKK